MMNETLVGLTGRLYKKIDFSDIKSILSNKIIKPIRKIPISLVIQYGAVAYLLSQNIPAGMAVTEIALISTGVGVCDHFLQKLQYLPRFGASVISAASIPLYQHLDSSIGTILMGGTTAVCTISGIIDYLSSKKLLQ